MRPSDLIGRRLADKYTLEALLGVGGFGAVYRARQAPIDRVVAVKVNLHPHRTDLRARFVREARLQAELRHPGCVMLLDCGDTDGLFYLVQEFVDGRSLKAALSRGPLAPDRTIELVSQVLAALSEAHRHHIVHRDVKPANVMLTRGAGDREEVRVLDFGIAKMLVSSGDDTESLTGTGMSLGTPAYMAPEQIRPGPIGPPTDVYAVGAMLYRMLAGRPVFGGATIDILTQQLNDPPPLLPAGLSMFDPIIARAMAKPSAERYQTADEMGAALRAVALGGAASVTDSGSATDLLDQTVETPPLRLLARPVAAASGSTEPSAAPVSPPETPVALPPAPDAPVAAPSAAPGPAADAPTPGGSGAEPSGAGRRRAAPWLALAALVVSGVALGSWLARPDEAAVGAVDAGPADAIVFDAVAAEIADAAPPDAVPPDAAPDAAPPDAALPDAAPPRRPPRPRPERPRPARAPRPDPLALQRRFESEIEACRCADARRTLATLRARVGDRVKPLVAQHEAACVLFIPGNCQSR